MYDAKLSSDIYNHLTNGRVINRHKLDNESKPIENPLFHEVMNNRADYQRQYDMCGLELVLKETYLYVRERPNGKELKTEIAMKVAVLLLVIGKYLNENGFKLSKITDPTAGLTAHDIARIEAMDDVEDILDKADIKGGLLNAIRNTLFLRGIMNERVGTQAYLLSNAGEAFFKEIVENASLLAEEPAVQ